MKIGYYGKNITDWLTPFIVIARGKGMALENVKDLSLIRDSELDVFIISPSPSLEKNYWDEISHCVNSNPDIKFLFLTPFNHDQRNAQERLGEQKNIEYLTLRDQSTKKLYDLLN